jgi:predicted TIM-barrel fold metal-dependent hydrolase
MIHTGTSVFPGARSRVGEPMAVDDVAVDFPELKIVLAHGGRPLWMDQAFFLVRRFPNVYMDISSIPPRAILRYFPRLAEVAAKVLYGSDWPAPGVRSMGDNLRDFRALDLPAEAFTLMLETNAGAVFG